MPIKGNVLKNTIGGYSATTKKFRVLIDNSDIVNGSLLTHSANLFQTFEGTTFSNGGATSYGRKTFASGDVNITTDNFYVPAHKFINNDTIIYYKGTTLISPLVNGTTYYVVFVDVDNFKLSLTSGGAAINITVASDGYFIPTIATVTGIVQRFLTTLNAAFSYSTITYSGNTSYFDITHSADYILSVTNTSGIYASFTLIQEYITGAGGTFSVIGSQQLNDDIFLFLAGSETTSEISKVSEIGVLYSTDNDATFSYVTLIRSKKLGFSPYKRIQCELEKVGNQINFYFTDGLNAPKAMYLDVVLKRTAFGFLKNLNGGRYDLQTVNQEAALSLQNPTAYFKSVDVIENAGLLTAGNKRYSGRFATADFTYTDFMYPTNPVNIFKESFNKPYIITGDLPSVITEKGVSLTLTNITPGVYAYFELVAIEYQGEIFSAKKVQRFNLTDFDTEITIQHTEQGQENISLSNAELLAITQKFISAQTLKIFDNRMTLSNLTEEVDLNLNVWSQTIQHEIKRGSMRSIGKAKDLTNQDIEFTLAEYINPKNVYEKTSYMYNDTYRFGIQVQWKSGKWSLPYWVDDIRIDVNTTNWNTIDNRRIAPSFSTLDLTDNVSNNVFYYYVNFSNIDLEYTEPTTGKLIRELIVGYRIVRSERIPEVLATGYFVSGAQATTNEIVPYFDQNDYYLGAQNTYPNSYVYEVQNINADVTIARDPARQVTSTDYSDYLFFYSPDYYFNLNGSAYTKTITDKLLIFGRPTSYQNIMGRVANGTVYASSYSEDTGYTASTSFSSYSILDQAYIAPGDNTIINSKTVWTGLRTEQHQASCRDANVFRIGTKLGGSKYYGQLFRDLGAGAKYTANKEFSFYQSTGHLRILTSTDVGVLNDDVVGGDVFNQKTYMLLRMGQPIATVSGGAGVVQAVYSQNILNTQMFNYTEWDNTTTGSGYAFPQYSNKVYDGYFKYSGTSTIINILSITAPRTWNLTGSTTGLHLGLTVIVNGNVTHGSGGPSLNGVRLYISLISPGTPNSVELTYFNGTISTPVIVSGSVTLTVPSLNYIPTNTTGSGLFAYAQQQLSVSNNNTYSKSYDFKDGTITEKGYNSASKYDGKKPASIAWSAKKEIGSLKDNYRVFQPSSFADLDVTSGEISVHEIINNNFYTFQERSVQRQYFRDPSAIGGDNGSDIVIGSGSIMVSRGQEITNTGTSKKWSVIKGKTTSGKETVYWFNDRLQKILRFGEDGSRVISDKGLLSYLLNNAKYNINTPEHLRGLGINGVWNDRYGEFILTFKYNNGVSNNAFTLVYDEIKNGFICFHTYYPNIYIPYNNNFFSPNSSASNQLFLHDSGSESTFYGTAQDANIEMVMNYEPNISKNFEALQIVSEQKPFAANFTTKNHISFLVQNDFDLREDLYYSNIKNDSTGTGVNSNDTSRLWGRWLKIKINLKSTSVGQKLINAIVKFRAMPRLYNQ
jgi:hypothetical protein